MKNQKKHYLDGLSFKVRRPLFFDLPLADFVLRHKKSSTAYYKSRITSKFVSEGTTSLYINQEDMVRIRKGEKIFPIHLAVDSLLKNAAIRPNSEKLIFLRGKEDSITERIKEKYSDVLNYLTDLFRGSVEGVTVVRMWNVSIVSSVIFGMFLMTMIYRYLGQGVYAGTEKTDQAAQEQIQAEINLGSGQDVAGEGETNYASGDYDEYTAKLIEDYNNKVREGIANDNIEEDIRQMVKGYPIEKMAPYIAKKDRLVAMFLIAIAKKESDWGKHVPICDGEDSFNYWGFRAKSETMGTGGHTCFDTREEAVDRVAKRLEFLVSNEKVNTPDKMVVVWKCGYDCGWDDPVAVRKWVSDVNMYFGKFDEKVSKS